jgi:hypothetical protein
MSLSFGGIFDKQSGLPACGAGLSLQTSVALAQGKGDASSTGKESKDSNFFLEIISHSRRQG